MFIGFMKIQIWSYLCKNVTNPKKIRYAKTFVLNYDNQLLYLFLLTWKTNKFIKHKTIIPKIDFALSFIASYRVASVANHIPLGCQQ